MHFNFYSWSDDEGRKISLLSFDELYSLAKAKGIKNVSAPSGSSNSNTSSGGDFDPSSQLAVGEGGNYVRYGINGYKGNDEALMKHLAFAKLCLLKECYEGLGILL